MLELGQPSSSEHHRAMEWRTSHLFLLGLQAALLITALTASEIENEAEPPTKVNKPLLNSLEEEEAAPSPTQRELITEKEEQTGGQTGMKEMNSCRFRAGACGVFNSDSRAKRELNAPARRRPKQRPGALSFSKDKVPPPELDPEV